MKLCMCIICLSHEYIPVHTINNFTPNASRQYWWESSTFWGSFCKYHQWNIYFFWDEFLVNVYDNTIKISAKYQHRKKNYFDHDLISINNFTVYFSNENLPFCVYIFSTHVLKHRVTYWKIHEIKPWQKKKKSFFSKDYFDLFVYKKNVVV